MWTQAKFLKHIPGQEIKDSILDNNPLPSNFLSCQKSDEYFLEILSEAGGKDEIFSLMKAHKYLTNIMGPTTGLPLATLRSPEKR